MKISDTHRQVARSFKLLGARGGHLSDIRRAAKNEGRSVNTGKTIAAECVQLGILRKVGLDEYILLPFGYTVAAEEKGN